MAGTLARLSVRDAIGEILKRQRQQALAATNGEGRAPPPAPGDSMGEGQFPSGGFIDHSLASPSEVDNLIDIDWKTQRKRRQYEQREGIIWPKTEEGRNYDGHHTQPKADGGGDGLGNFEPMHPLEHRRHHMENGDFSRWGSWSRGKKPSSGPEVKGLGWFGLIPDITGIFSGRIRTNTLDNLASDFVGIPSEEDRRKAFEERQRWLNPKWKPGDPIGM